MNNKSRRRTPYKVTPPIKTNKRLVNVPIKTRKTYINKGLKEKIWLTTFGIKFQVKCPCCKIREINPFSFSTGHIEAEANGGKSTVSNLIPICCHCNSRMGTLNYYDYKKLIS
tara:strand:- start:2275 stop:2613 length:339 start_codon:yes stop_codon:yes gene_type:complete